MTAQSPVVVHSTVIDAVIAHLVEAGLVVFVPREHGRPTPVDIGILDGLGRMQSIAVRGASLRQRVHRVRRREQRYEYKVLFWGWNLHVHGKRVAQPDWWVLVPDLDASAALVIPGPELRDQRTVAFSLGARNSRYCAYRRAWPSLLLLGKKAA